VRLFVLWILSICLVCCGKTPNSEIDSLVEKAKKGDKQASEGERKVLEGDIDADGDRDYTVLFSLSGFGGGNNDRNYVAVLVNEGTQLKPIGPFILGREGVWWADLRDASVDGKVLQMSYAQFIEGDPRCCPSIKGRIVYEWSDNSYVAIRREQAPDEPDRQSESTVNEQERQVESQSERASIRGLSLGTSADQLISQGVAGGTIFGAPIGRIKQELEFLGQEPDRVSLWRSDSAACSDSLKAAAEKFSGTRPWMTEVIPEIKCRYVGYALVDANDLVTKLALESEYFEADPRTTAQDFMQQIMEAYDIPEFEYVGRQDDSIMFGRGAVKDSWSGVASTGETFTVLQRALGLQLEVEARAKAKF
jgi:hypothetical protein